MKFLLPFCSCNITWITDILNVKKTLHKVFAFHYVMCNASNSANIDTMAPLSHNFVTLVFPAGNIDKTYGHVNDVYWKTAVYTGVRYSISDVINDRPALSCGLFIDGINYTKL